MVVRIWIVIERPLWRAFFRPGLQGGELLECWQVVAAARCHELLNRSVLRQMDQQALGSFLVLGEVPDAPEIRKERCKAALRSRRKAMRPALLGDLRRVTLGDRPGAGRIHDQCALSGKERLVVIGVIPGRDASWQQGDELLVEFESLPHRVSLDRDVALGVDQLSAKSLEKCAGGIGRVARHSESDAEGKAALVAGLG